MAANTAEFRIVVNADGLVTGMKQVRAFGEETKKAAKGAKDAGEAHGTLNYRMNQGVVGASSAARSFSKLNQTIGQGNSGLVGAYATLAANAFAVSAAFNALRTATQAEMILKGLEEQGARTGRTLTLAAERLREVVGFGISAADSMSATAMFTSTGFSTDELERLGQVAQNTSLALGRNLPDSLDRLIKGTTKLEPELLDELGIMTKLGDATAAYALEINKPVAALTQFERRQAFLNAVLEEGEIKFGGLNDKIQTNPYDKLAATFSNLTRDVTNFINSGLGLSSLVNFLSDNSLALSGVLLLFASTIKNQLLGSLSDLAMKSVENAEISREYANQVKSLTAANIKRAQSEAKSAIQQAANITLHEKSAAAIKKQAEALTSGSLSVEELDKVIKTNERSLAAHIRLLEKDKELGKDTSVREQTIKGLQDQASSLNTLRTATANYNAEAVKSVQVQIANSQAAAANSRARSQEYMATAIQSLNNGNLNNSYVALLQSSRQYSISLALETKAKRLAAVQGGFLEKANYQLARSTQAAMVATNFAVSGIKLLGAALLRFIPYIGMAMIAWDMLVAGYEAAYSFLFPKTAAATELVQEKMDALVEVNKNAAKAQEQYNRILNSSMALGAKYSLASEQQANAIAEQTNALKELIEAKIAEQRISGEESFFDFLSINPSAGSRSSTVNSISKELTRNLSSTFKDPEILKSINNLQVSLGEAGLKTTFAEVGFAVRPLSDKDLPALVDALDKINQKKSTTADTTKNLRDAIDNADAAVNKLADSLLVSTGYDETIKQFDEIINSINTLVAAGESDLAITAQLTDLGPAVQMFLSKDMKQLLDSFREADRIVSELGSKQGTLSTTDFLRLGAAKQLLSTQGNYVEQVKDALESARADLDIKREAIVLSQAQATLEQNRHSIFKQYLNSGAAGYRAQISSEEKVRSLTVASLAANKAIIDAKISVEQANIANLETQLKGLEAEQNSLLNIQEYNNQLIRQIYFLEARNELISGSGNWMANSLRSSGMLPANPAEQALREAAQGQASETQNNNIAETQAQLEAARRSLVSLQLASKLLGTQISSELVKGLTETEIAAKAELARREALFENYQRDEATRDAQHASNMSAYRTAATLKGLDDTLGFKLQEIDREFAYRNSALQRSLNEETLLIEARIADARAMRARANAEERKGIDEFIAQQNNILTNLNAQTAAKQGQLSLDREANIVSEIGLNTEVKRQEALIKSTEFLIKQLDVLKESAEASLELIDSIRELEAARGGFSRSESALLQRADRIEQAKQAVEIAGIEFETRKAIITMEYALLEAKRKEAIKAAIDERTGLQQTLRGELSRDTPDSARVDELHRSIAITESMLTNLGAKFTQNGIDYGEGFNNILEENISNLEKAYAIAINRARAASEQGPRIQGGMLAQFNLSRSEAERANEPGSGISQTDLILNELDKNIARTQESLRALGPEGELVLAVVEGASLMSKAFLDLADKIKEGDFGSIAVAGLQAMSAAIQTISSVLKASSDAKIANIDREIAAEQKRDGQSAASVEKIRALEKKKESIARKQFETNKKLMIAQAITSTAAGIAGALASPPVGPWNIALAALIGAMGAAQIAVIAGTQFESSSASSASVQPPSTLSIGRRSDTVDLARGPSANAGGEVGFIRGSEGMGTNASNFRTIGSAYGGELMRGYGNRGFVVGEKGPEVISPETPINVTPANDVMQSAPVNATINIQALDASGVQDVLVAQKGNIIKMLREAANASGQGFLEDVNVNVYTRPSINKL